MPPQSPYAGLPERLWEQRTRELVDGHPLDMRELVEVCLQSWDAIFHSAIGPRRFRIGVDIMPVPQIMAFLLHELIPLELQRRYPSEWRRDASSREKDLVYLPEDTCSVEIKTSSHRSRIFGNRSYAQPGTATKKSKDGFYLAINFEKFGKAPTPQLTLIRFGWLDHTDWRGQAAATGQQASLTAAAELHKLQVLWAGVST